MKCVGVNVVVARRIGCHNSNSIPREHCAVALGGAGLLLSWPSALLFSRPMLE